MGLHGTRTRRGSVKLEAGWHKFKAYHFENGGGSNMTVKYKGPDSRRWTFVEGSHDGDVEEIDLPKGANLLQTEEDNINEESHAMLK